MLVTACRFGQWIEITHRSGDVLRIRVMPDRIEGQADARLVFDDDARHFAIERPGRRAPDHAIGAASSPPGLADKT